MRVVGGAWKGHPLDAPDGRATTRPTTDRTREAMVSMVSSYFGLDVSGVSMLDAYAGSGAIGIEFLSRGAKFVCFCDKDRQAQARIKKNLGAVKADRSTYKVIGKNTDKLCFTSNLSGAPFNLVVLDPPYKKPSEEVDDLLEGLDRAGYLSDDCVVIYEHDNKNEKLELKCLHLVKAKKYGTCLVDMYAKG